MKKLKMNTRYFMQLRQSPSMTSHLTTQRIGDLSKSHAFYFVQDFKVQPLNVPLLPPCGQWTIISLKHEFAVYFQKITVILEQLRRERASDDELTI